MVISTDQNTSLRTMSPFISADLIDHAAHGKIANATKLANSTFYLKLTLQHNPKLFLNQHTGEISPSK